MEDELFVVKGTPNQAKMAIIQHSVRSIEENYTETMVIRAKVYLDDVKYLLSVIQSIKEILHR